MRIIVLDGAEMTSRAALHDYLAARLDLPDWYGRNLDALYDCLTDRSRPTLLVLCREEALATALGDYGRRLVRVLERSAAESPALTFARDGDEV